MTLTGTTQTTAVLAITGDGNSSGALVTFSHTTATRNDVLGTASSWAVTGQGNATFNRIDLGDDDQIRFGATQDATIEWVNASSLLNIAGAVDFDNNITMAASASITQAGVGGSTMYTITAGDVVWSDSSLLLTDADNAESVTIINNTATTIGAAVTAAILQIESTSLTTGAAVNVQLTEGTLNGGFYYSAWDATASARVFSVGENGDMIITGTAAADALTITNGDVVLSDGSLTMTDADNAATVSITNSTATTANTVLFTGSGVFTGSGTTAFFRITQSGANSGDVVNIQCDGLTTGTAVRVGSTGTIITTGRILELVADSATTSAGLVDLTADGLTTGIGVLFTSTSLALAAGQLLNIDHTCSGTISAAKTGQLIDVVSSRTHTAATAISDDYDVLSILRTSVNVNAGGTLNAAGSCLFIQNTATQTDGTLADTSNGIEIDMVGGAEAQGYGISLTHSGTTVGRAISIAASQTTGTVLLVTAADLTTTGVGLSITNNTSTGLTSGSLVRVNTATTGAVATNGVVSIRATGAFTSTANVGILDVAAVATLAGTIARIAGGALTTGVGLLVDDSGTGITSGSLLRVSSATTGAVATNGVVNFVASGAHTSTAGIGFVNVSDATATGIAVSVFANSLTTGSALLVSSSGTITSAGQGLVNIVGTGITTGDGLKIDLTEGTLTTGNYLNCYDDTAGATVFRIAEDGATTITGVAGSTVLTITAGDVVVSDGAIASAREQVTLGAGVTAIAIDSNFVEVTGDGGGNTVTTITGGVAGQIIVLIFVDGNVTINDDNTHGANSIDLVGANTTFADDATLTLIFDGTSYYEITRSVND